MGIFSKLLNRNVSSTEEERCVIYSEDEYWNNPRYHEISGYYYDLLPRIEYAWSNLYNTKNYTGSLSQQLEESCIVAIKLYKQMISIANEYDETLDFTVPPYTRLCMLFERRGEYQYAIDVCIDAMESGVFTNNLGSRIIKNAKKLNRNLTEYEQELIDVETKYIETQLKNKMFQ